MLPTFTKYKINYIVGLWITLAIVSILLSFAFTRNANDPTNVQTFTFCAVLAGGISFVTLRDAIGFWAYGTAVKKFHITHRDKRIILSYQESACKRMGTKLLLHPASGLISVSSTLMIVLYFTTRFLEINNSLVLMAVIGIGFPTLLSTYIFFLLPAYVALADSTIKNTIDGTKTLRLRNRIRICIAGDMAMTLGINLSVVLPLSGDADFSLAKGYLSPNFLAATLIMIWIVTFFTLQGAKRSRIFSAAGEVLSRNVRVDAQNEPHVDELAIPGKSLKGALLIYVGISLWSVLAALAFTIASVPPYFGWFYSVLLTPLMTLFVYNRGARLTYDYAQARLLEAEMPEFSHSVNA